MPRRGSKRPRPVVGNPQDPQGMAAYLSRHLEWMGVAGYVQRTIENR